MWFIWALAIIMENMVEYRSIIPLFNYGGVDIQLSGNYQGAQFRITMDYLDQTGRPNNSILNQYLLESQAETVYNDVFFKGRYSIIVPTPCPIIIIDTKQGMTEDHWVSSNSLEHVKIESAILQSLNLLCSKGLLTDKTYSTRLTDRYLMGKYKELSLGLSQGSPNQPFNLFYFGNENGKSNLKEEEIDSLSKLFNEILTSKEEDTPYRKILSLSTAFYRSSQCQGSIDHSFLLLSIVIETIFKLNQTEYFSQATERCKEALNLDDEILNGFFDYKNQTSLNELRNSIAHGKMYDSSELKNRYDLLFSITRNSIIELILNKEKYLTKDHSEWFNPRCFKSSKG